MKGKDIERDDLSEVGDKVSKHASHHNRENTLKNTLPASHHRSTLI